MSAVTEPHGGSLLDWSSHTERVDRAVRLLPEIELATLESGAALLTRVDHKYVVPLTTFERLLASLDSDWGALEICGRRLFGYASTYFDTSDLHTYRAHLQRRRKRFKVRVRRYVDSDSCMLEVKRKGLRGVTIKERTPHPILRETDLGESGHAFVARVIEGHALLPTEPLHPVVKTSNRRATLASLSSRARLTVDTDLTCGWSDAHATLRPGLVLVESKSEGLGSCVDRLLRRLGERPVSISKYCVGVSSLGLDVPDNPWRRSVRRYFESCSEEELCSQRDSWSPAPCWF